ncbi:piggyBac transposable element-derived protein 4-like [Corythoichthys intestinalis]|uniref:piggyBac transposable element-derived protein 4-like n=1 Tax=Corythoichthys intestinalis TaxID=161448 RepID=UPI0025A62597|nr:piggyBac transposable element-derived protein 4-like [Corythoichthys intestinalis]XP_061811804.1 piggyBac transposable element-derived protein 4-like [Nerophis lumbriciformis]
MFITENIIEEVLKCTNLEGRRAAAAKGKVWRNIEKEEFMAFIGLTLLSGGEKNWDVALRELFLDQLQNPMYKAITGLRRYEDIRLFIRFDNRRTMALRLETEYMAAFKNLQVLQYMPSKPAKYGIKIFWKCDARVPYAIDGIVYTGRQPGEEVQRNLGENIFLKLSSGIIQTGRNITIDNFFTSVPLAEKNLTILGTLSLNKPDIPPITKPSNSLLIHSSEFGFNGNMTMVSYVQKKGRAVVLLSTMHDDKAVDDTPKKKPDVIHYYNRTKGGLDTTDQMVGTNTCKRRTRRWPMVLWYNMLDIATLNAYTSFNAEQPGYFAGVTNARRLFIKELGKELVMPHMKSRLEGTPTLQKHIIEAMGRCGIEKQSSTGPQEDKGTAKRKRCAICPSAKDQKASSCCSRCKKPVCKEHNCTVVIFDTCEEL